MMDGPWLGISEFGGCGFRAWGFGADEGIDFEEWGLEQVRV